MKTPLMLFLALGLSLIAQGAPQPRWTYRELTRYAELVVIARPIASRVTSERKVVGGFAAMGVETELEVRAVLKGDATLQRVTLHHYKLPPGHPTIIDGPAFHAFDAKKGDNVLLFLRQEADGRYAPVSPQEYFMLSVQALPGDRD